MNKFITENGLIYHCYFVYLHGNLASMARRPKSKCVIILQTCLLTGTLDALAAILISYKIPPAIIFKFIASGWFGRQAMSGGTYMIVFGLIFHYLIAAFFTVILFLLYPRVVKILKSRYLVGIVYGLAIWGIMNYVVLPMTNIPKSHGHLELISLLKGIVALIVCIGLPVALIADNEMTKNPQPV
ncbi:hypothetical protein [Mucilaginibacter sp. BT774]|uniref:hypothetical protein n=1 Tax=Mucilaginibacter sp. BT774 TaxID=3062276 RepID=UPI0026761B93|nr:hypothetical protein [Mucilaginibacter sp. BT774]